MKRTTVLLLLAFALSACIPALPTQPPPPTAIPPVDVEGTAAALAMTQVAQTLTALPSPTEAPASDTPAPPAAPTDTAIPSATQTQSGTASPTVNPAGVTATPVTFTATSAIPTATKTLGPLIHGTLPPFVAGGRITLENKAKRQVYVSLRCVTVDEGLVTYLEYPVSGKFNISAPAGWYDFVAWVGGREIKGSFKLVKKGELTLTFYKDKVVVSD